MSEEEEEEGECGFEQPVGEHSMSNVMMNVNCLFFFSSSSFLKDPEMRCSGVIPASPLIIFFYDSCDFAAWGVAQRATASLLERRSNNADWQVVLTFCPSS